MSLGSVSGFQHSVCPSCGATQESSGSTVCENCGAELSRSGSRYSSPSTFSTPSQRLSVGKPSVRVLPRFKIRLKVPRFLRRGPVVVLLIAALVFGLSFVPEVNARVPVLKKISAPVKKAVKRARSLGWIPAPKAKAKGTSRRSSSPSATARKGGPQPAGNLLLKVETDPAGATVAVGSRVIGKTPVTVKVAPGTHKVTFTRKGYETATRTVTMKPGKSGQLHVALIQERAASPQPARTQTAKPTAPSKPSAAPATRKPSAPTRKPAPVAKRPAAAAPASGRLLETGTRAPAISLKAPNGAFHRLSDYRNKQVVVLFIWSLDSQTMRLVQDLDGRVRSAGQSMAGMVVVVNGDRAAVQKFATSSRVQVPIVLGDDPTARAYGVPKSTNVVYLISEGGLVTQRQVRTIQLGALFSLEQKEGR